MSVTSLISKPIRYKALEHERVEDAPFVGALISACDCRFNCQNCFNQHLKQLPTIERPCGEIITEVLSNSFNKGIILGGLEWTLQKDELLALAIVAKENRLKTMLYTGYTINAKRLVELTDEYRDYFDYVKCGRYREEKKTANHIEHGVILASKNQHIYEKWRDY